MTDRAPSMWRFARTYMGPYAAWYGVGVVALVATNWISVTIPLYVGGAIDAVRHGDVTVIPHHAAWIAVLGVIVIATRTVSRVLFFTPGRLVEAALKHDLFATLIRQQADFHRERPPGDLVSRMASDVTYMRLVAGFVALTAVNATIASGMAVVQMSRLSPTLTLWLLLPLVVSMGVAQLLIRKMFELVRAMQVQSGELAHRLLSSYQGIATLQGFGAEAAFLARFEEPNQALLRTTLERARLRAVIAPTLALAMSLTTFVLLFVGGPMAVRGQLSVGDLVALTTLLAFLAGPVRAMSFLLSTTREARAALERISAVLDTAPERPDLPNPRPAPTDAPAIRVRDLSFAYPDEPDRVALRGVSFDLAPGQTLGVLGPTGSGKTTLLRLLARVHNPGEGQITLNGDDLRAVDLDGWRRILAYVPQRAFLFSEPLADNIVLGGPRDERLADVLRLTALDVDVAALPDGVDTLVGEAGVMLSGGQRQRAALARGLYRAPKVLLLDDVLSAVDHSTEAHLTAALQRPESRPTTVIVANRLSALAHADEILVLEGGEVVDRGRHEELIARPGLYQDTWRVQSRSEVAS